MTERELRELVADTAIEYLGCNEADGTHKPIIDLYNTIKPLPRGYKLSYYDPWCAGFISAVGEERKLGHIIFPECSCDAMINLYKAAGRWREADDYVPQTADIVMYDWGDSGVGDNVGGADHVGFIYAKDGNNLTVIEGNISDSVNFRNLKVNGRYIRGYCCPDYASAASSVDAAKDREASEPTVIIATQQKLVSEVKLPELCNGDKSNAVEAMQILLIGYGFRCGTDGADGEFGPNTDKALRKFQQDRGLTVDGVCGVNAWRKLLGL